MLHARPVRAVSLAVLLAALLSAGPASASHNKIVTLAARYCPTYDAIRANEARNNIMESLHDLGPDTPYGPSDAMDPDVEAATQPACRPLAGWRFTLGTGYQSRAVPGPWGALSKVTDPYPRHIATHDSVPLLNNVNEQTHRTIAGAVTVELNDSERDQAARANLWVMGGTPTDPVAEPDQYAFGALRCGVDNLNGDNVEYVSYPTGATHVFCFAYYVKPAPTSGTIVVRKQLQGVPAGTPPQSVRFTGNISYEHNVFVLTASPSKAGEATFYRAAGATWSFGEDAPPPGEEFAGLQCSSSTGASTVTADEPNRAASVLLGAGDVVTCTFTDRYLPPPGLLLRKVSLGKVGTFRFSVTGPATREQTVTTTQEGIAAAEPELSVPRGDYEIREQAPVSARGTWALESVFCGGREITALDPAHVTVPASGSLVCTFTNRFTPSGAIRVRKETLGGVTTTGFYIVPTFGTPGRYVQTATTSVTGRPVLADGDDTSALPLGQYIVQETAPFVADPPGTWVLDAVVCDGVPVASEEGQILVTLTAANPEIDCTFTNGFTRKDEEPAPPPTSTPPPPVPTPLPGPSVSVRAASVRSDPEPNADLVVTKTAKPTSIVLGHRVRYVVTVRNRGPASARAVTLVEREARGEQTLALRASKGRCTATPPRFCAIGTLARGERATMTVTVRPRRVGTLTNTVVANTATHERNVNDQTATAVVHVRRAAGQVGPQFTG
jgi:hypothetical protein